MILGLRHKDDEAARSFVAALSLAPTFAEAYAHLATLRIRQGCIDEALGLQTQAVKYAPQSAAYAEQLQAYQALAGRQTSPMVTPDVAKVDSTEAPDEPSNDWPKRLETLDWHALANRLTRDGCAAIAGLLDASTCQRLRGLFDDDKLFSKTVVLYFERPLAGFRWMAGGLPGTPVGVATNVAPRASERGVWVWNA